MKMKNNTHMFLFQPVVLSSPKGRTTCEAGVVRYTCKVGGPEAVRRRVMGLPLRALRKQREQLVNPLRSIARISGDDGFVSGKYAVVESEAIL
jgi:hypothetical protein